MKPDDVKLAIQKLNKAIELLRSLDDFATTLLGKTSEALDLCETADGLLTGKLRTDANGNIEDAP